MDKPPTTEQVDELWEQLTYARHSRKRNFFTGLAVTAVVIAAGLTLATVLLTGYTWGTSLLWALIGSGLYTAGAYTGFTAFDEWIEVRTVK